jgi:nucleoside-diphosphate-sugar epimerase
MKTAVIAGVGGVAGRGLVDRLAAHGGWNVIGLARRPPDLPGVRTIAVDLLDANACREQLGGLREATHLFYAGRFDHAAGKLESVEHNLAMLTNMLDAIEPAARDLQHIHLAHGTKYYGSHLGPFPTPAREEAPRGLGPVFYYAQQDHIMERQRGKDWTWSVSRPHGLLHAVAGVPRNLVSVIAVYAVIMRELGLPLSFPGTLGNYRAIYQCTSVDQLAESMIWMATEPRCANQAYNVINGDYIRWEMLWPAFARYFGMEAGPVRTVRLADAMHDKAGLWQQIVQRYDLVPWPLDQVALWSYGDFVLTPDWDIMSDVTKSRQHGFQRTVRTEDEFLRMFDLLRAQRVLP